MRRAATVLAALLTVLLTLSTAACNSATQSSRCADGVCQVTLSGEQTLSVQLNSVKHELRVGSAQDNAVAVSTGGDEVRLAVGESAGFGDLAVRVVSIDGSEVQLEVQRSE